MCDNLVSISFSYCIWGLIYYFVISGYCFDGDGEEGYYVRYVRGRFLGGVLYCIGALWMVYGFVYWYVLVWVVDG